MTGKEKTEFRRSKEWKDFRIKLLEKRGYKCECCGVKSRRLQVHHIFPENYTNLEESRFALLCSSCHETVSRIERIKNFQNYDTKWLNFYARFVGALNGHTE